jgi:predicted protein tyrosine phosphatase
MIKSSRNQLANTGNPYQGKAKRVLCVCSAGLLRSPTAAKLLQQEYGYNTRACGVSEEYALIPISEALVTWADEIVFMEKSHYYAVRNELNELLAQDKVVILNIKDSYSFDSEELKAQIKEQYNATNL